MPKKAIFVMLKPNTRTWQIVVAKMEIEFEICIFTVYFPFIIDETQTQLEFSSQNPNVF